MKELAPVLTKSLAQFIAEELQQRRVGVDDGEVEPPIPIEVEGARSATVGGGVQARHGGDVEEVAAVTVQEQVIALVTAE
jgi:hypothetical protein